MGLGQKARAAAAAAAAYSDKGDGAPGPPTLADFLDFPALGQPPPQPSPSQRQPTPQNSAPQPSQWQPPQPQLQQPPQPSRPTQPMTAASASQQAQGGPPYTVSGSKKGGFPVSVETRAKGKKVTVVHNVSGDVDALLRDIKGVVGSGGVVRDGDAEVQGEHTERVEAFLLKKGCIKGVSHVNKAAAAPKPKESKSTKSIARLDQKAAALKQKQ
mmetsp:Transcript_23912/g.39551  ORF Transcript_23912/g.39551 Transcript_23912/m.39551 type:complete len:214 (-) Transcript_23912:239-880(-)